MMRMEELYPAPVMGSRIILHTEIMHIGYMPGQNCRIAAPARVLTIRSNPLDNPVVNGYFVHMHIKHGGTDLESMFPD